MTARQFTLEDLKRILIECAGADEAVDLDGEILDEGFEAIGYESLAILETGGRIETEYEVCLDEAVLSVHATPRELIAAVNELLTVAA
ncbi:phosphopantetheine-binding protein [Actinacidiphila paucisporea]|uniref:Act minimal PKS acyl carrier protein n=1 Tax=Actinacidiphila paucisporea TaxID=310782 RepID=A0A1M7QYJ6_9ACTN|nr:phosphopantetheine-binding protein [Actinacidiphila paucisporea]SHN37212.1 act minimal PKS acyl carrier protein [Actinacidiphila paucisporea]